jgi:hypothetical protein
VSLGRRGGLKGGKARAAAMTPERRAEIARKAAPKRWSSKQRLHVKFFAHTVWAIFLT